MYNKQPSEPVPGKEQRSTMIPGVAQIPRSNIDCEAQEKLPSKDSSGNTVSSSASEEHHASRAEEAEVPSEWHDRRYTDEDFALLEKQLKDDDEDFRPTPQQVESLKSHYLHEPVGAIQYYIALGRAPPDNWVELSLYIAAYDWMERCP